MQWWNPTIEEQAIDRAHRIGQTRTVHVTRITIAGTDLTAVGHWKIKCMWLITCIGIGLVTTPQLGTKQWSERLLGKRRSRLLSQTMQSSSAYIMYFN